MDESRQIVVSNIQKCVAERRFNDRVEPGDPDLDEAQIAKLLEEVVHKRETLGYKVKNLCARILAKFITRHYAKNLVIDGLEKVRHLEGPAIVTSNHFEPFESTIIRSLAAKCHKRLYTVSTATNFAMTGLFGFLLNYTDIIPIGDDKYFMKTHFDEMLTEVFKKKKWVLMYPEQEMWWRYRKVRPLKRGVYHYASKHNVPVISCFVEMHESEEKPGKLKFVLHVMDIIYPDPAKDARDNSFEMMETDYRQKTEAYEKAYGKKLDYTFSNWDIAGLS